MNNIWNQLDAKKRRLIVVVSTFAFFSGAIALLPGGSDEKSQAVKNENITRGILTDVETEGARFDQMIAQLDNLREENHEIRKELERVYRDFKRVEMGDLGPAMSREMRALREHIQFLEDRVNEGTAGRTVIVEGDAADEGNPSSPRELNVSGNLADGTPIVKEPGRPFMSDLPKIELPKGTEPKTEPQQYETGVNGETVTPSEIWEQPVVVATANEDGRRGGRRDENAPAPGVMRIIEQQKTAEEIAQEQAERENEELGVYMPAGSIITGTIVSGMDAPTGQAARQNPFPSLIRIKHEAILPNRYRADVRECFALLGGYGDLSSERAYLRGETFTCIREDGKVLEAKFEAYAVGEDGKAGLRGRLVSKQGQLLAKSLTAGVLQGFSSAFNNVPVPTLALNDGENTSNQQLYQQAFSSEALQSGAVSGVGKALDRLAQFYIDQAEAMYPVIEIDAGREIEIILVSGGRLGIQ